MTINTALPTPRAPTGISVIVVGLGFGGLTAAIESHLRGHSVILLEKVTKVKQDAGDAIVIGPNAVRLIKSWGEQLCEEIEPHLSNATHAEMLDHHDRFIVRHELAGRGKG
ncbi:hypothetical protein KXV73_000464, partial [Aspergillus fumigatus]